MLPAWYPETKGLNINTYPRSCTNCICNQLNLGILKIGVLPYNEILKFWTCALIAPSPSIIASEARPVARNFQGGFRNVTWVHKIGNVHHFYKSNYSCIIMYYNIMCSTCA